MGHFEDLLPDIFKVLVDNIRYIFGGYLWDYFCSIRVFSWHSKLIDMQFKCYA